MTKRRYAPSTVFEEYILESLFWLPSLLVLILEILKLHLRACCPAPAFTADFHYRVVSGWRSGMGEVAGMRRGSIRFHCWREADTGKEPTVWTVSDAHDSLSL